MFNFLTANTGADTGSLFTMLLPLVLLFAIMYFLMIRPQQKADKKKREMLNAMKKDDNVVTIGGIYGTIVDINEEDDIVTIAVGPDRVRFMIKKSAISDVESVGTEEPEIEDETEDETEEEIAETAAPVEEKKGFFAKLFKK